VGEATLVCGDHILDGVDLFITRDGDTFAPATGSPSAMMGTAMLPCSVKRSGRVERE
jgi:hypothetical protein